ncbi:cadherin-like beta sandwich domain-containing protein [Agathobacter rectalis]|uniref:cadherin-like beta sandwich domain-containing protein n=1 Tax=Agathobacter rectalis TaxID=39491 RepID=UPI0031B56B82
MRRIRSIILTMMLILTTTLFCRVPVLAAANISVSVNKSNVKVGDTVTVTLSITSGYGAQGVLKKSSGVLGGSSDEYFTIGAGVGDVQRFSYKATSVGSCTFSIQEPLDDTTDVDGGTPSIGVGSATVTVTSASSNNDSNSNKDNKDNSGSNTGNDSNANKDNENKEEKKSSNASLGSLVISAGTLSPKFSAATKDYTATVDYSCSSLAVTANPADSKASVTSVTGNDSLEVGENTVSVVVTAEDGSTSTYNIVVTRRAEDDPENADKQDNWKKFDINGTEWTMVNDIPEDVVPEGFEHSKTVIDGLEYNTLHGTFGDVTLVYLQSESGNGLFVYDAAQNAAYEFVRINSESHFIVVLLPKVDDVPEGYNEISLSIEGKGVATAYQTKAEKKDDQTKDFYLVYAMNDNGESGWYTYDSVDGTYMRNELSTPTVAQEENDTTKSELVPGIANKYLVLAAILVLIIIILLLLLMVSAVKNRKYKAMDYHDDDDDVDDAAEDVSNEALKETTDETADEIADELEEEVTEEPLDEVAEEAAEESVDKVAGEAAEESAGEAAEETADEAVEEPADEVAEETAEDVADEQKMATDENISNASYVGRTVEITPDSKKAVENENSEFDLKDDSRQENVSDTENDADEDALKNQLQMALDVFVNEGNKPSETIDSSAKDDNEDDSEDDDLQFIDLN